MTIRDWVLIGLLAVAALAHPAVRNVLKAIFVRKPKEAEDEWLISFQSQLHGVDVSLEKISIDLGAICTSLSQPNPTLDRIAENTARMDTMELLPLLKTIAAYTCWLPSGEAIGSAIDRLDRIEKLLATITANTKPLESVEMILAESVAQTKGVMRAMTGALPNEDDDILERARALREQYPTQLNSWEKAIAKAREQATYVGR